MDSRFYCTVFATVLAFSACNGNGGQTVGSYEEIGCELKTYSNQFFSIDYPADWSVVENPDPMADVYIGSTLERIGFTVLHFPSELSLQEVNEEATANCINAGMVVSTRKTEVGGMTAYRNVHSYRAGLNAKEIGYTFKIGDEVFNVKFGTDPTLIDDNTELIEKIIRSFKGKTSLKIK